MNFDKMLQNSTPKQIAHIWQRGGISAIKLEAARIRLLIAVREAVQEFARSDFGKTNK